MNYDLSTRVIKTIITYFYPNFTYHSIDLKPRFYVLNLASLQVSL